MKKLIFFLFFASIAHGQTANDFVVPSRGNGNASNGEQWRLGYYPIFKVQKRITPTSVTLYTQAGTSGQWTLNGSNRASAACQLSETNINVCNNTGSASDPGTGAAYGHWTADSEI